MVSRFGKFRKISKPYCAKRAKILKNDPRFIDFSAAGENFGVFLKFDDFPLKFIKLRAAGAKKFVNLKTLFSTFNEIWKISKPSFQDSENLENPQNPRARFGIRFFKISKTWFSGRRRRPLKIPRPALTWIWPNMIQPLYECPRLCLNVSQSVRIPGI